MHPGDFAIGEAHHEGMSTNLSTPHVPTGPVPAPRTRQRRAGHIVAIVAGCLMILPSLGALAGGVAVVTAQAVATDEDGYFSFTLDRVETDGVAVATDEQWFDDARDEDAPWVLDVLDVDLRLRVDGAEGTDDVFVGVARTADVEAYLADSPHAVVTDIDDHTAIVDQVAGVREIIGAPSDQDFWVASASGTGEQTLDWEARGGRWSVVVMNADGGRGVAADVEVGARSGAITPIGVVLIVFGGIGTLLSIGLIVFGARGRRTPAGPASIGPVPGSPLPPPAPQPADQADTATTDRHDHEPTPIG